MLNLVRKRALPDYQGQGAIGLGSRGRKRAEVDVTGPLSEDGRLRGRVVALHENFGSPVMAMDGHKQALYGTVELDITSQSTVSVGATWQRGRGNYDTGLPAHADGRLAPIPRDVAIAADWGRAAPESLAGFIESETRLDGGGLFKVAARRVLRQQRDKYINGYSAVSDTGISRFTQAQPWTATMPTPRPTSTTARPGNGPGRRTISSRARTTAAPTCTCACCAAP